MNKFIRQKYKKKLINFEDQCKLIDYLSSTMKFGYKEQVQRPIHFDKQMSSFVYLKNHGLSI